MIDRQTMKKTYMLDTFEKFYNTYKDQPQLTHKKYSDTIIVIDEVHNLTATKMYPFYLDFLHNITNRKIIIMTGTPMTNGYTDIFPIMNLILLWELQISPTSTETALVTAFQGRISYLKLNSGCKMYHEHMIL